MSVAPDISMNFIGRILNENRLGDPGSGFNRPARLPAKTAQSKSNASEQRTWARIL